LDEAEDRGPEALERLKTLLAAERVRLGISIRPMNSPGSPVYHTLENVLPPGLVVGASLLATSLVHFYLGAAILAVGMVWWLAVVHPKVKSGVFDRTAALALADVASFNALWRSDVLSLYAKLPDGTERVAIRRDNWREFVLGLPEEGPEEATAAAPPSVA
jgi:hypothetical protein